MFRYPINAFVFIACVAFHPLAHAYEDQWSLDIAAGLQTSPKRSTGVGLSIGGSYGLSDMWTVRLAGQYFFHPNHSLSSHSVTVLSEAVYMLDVLQWVPFLGVGIDGKLEGIPSSHRLDIGAHAVIGIDYLWRPTDAVGLDFRSIGWLDARQISLQGLLRWSHLF